MDEATLSRLPADLRRHVEHGAARLAFHGYYRLLGRDSGYSFSAWNDPAFWRFAWPDLKTSYFFFGFSAWGDQYAVDLDDPGQGVLFLEAYEMSVERIATSFTEFLAQEFDRVVKAPYDSRTKQAFDRFGPLSWEEGLALVPPLLLAESEESCQAAKTNMRTLMTMNGDVFTALQGLKEGSEISRVETYRDGLGRERLRLVPKA